MTDKTKTSCIFLEKDPVSIIMANECDEGFSFLNESSDEDLLFHSTEFDYDSDLETQLDKVTGEKAELEEEHNMNLRSSWTAYDSDDEDTMTKLRSILNK